MCMIKAAPSCFGRERIASGQAKLYTGAKTWRSQIRPKEKLELDLGIELGVV
jgi:hypothetical protein